MKQFFWLTIYLSTLLITGCEEQAVSPQYLVIDQIVKPLPPPPMVSFAKINERTIYSLMKVEIRVGVHPNELYLKWAEGINEMEAVTTTNCYRMFEYGSSNKKVDSRMIGARSSVSFLFYPDEESLIQNIEQFDGILTISNMIADKNNDFYYLIGGYGDYKMSSKLVLYQLQQVHDSWEIVNRFTLEKS